MGTLRAQPDQDEQAEQDEQGEQGECIQPGGLGMADEECGQMTGNVIGQ
ncbi:hypothetical protein [Candidatus Amarolinea dominans]|nr:hypothetical protein [Anaerolineae bacterium]